MNAFTELAIKRQHLIAKSTLQREQIELYIDDLRSPIKTLDTGISAWNFIKSHPILMLGSTFILYRLRFVFLTKWLAQLATIRQVSQLLKRIFSH